MPSLVALNRFSLSRPGIASILMPKDPFGPAKQGSTSITGRLNENRFKAQARHVTGQCSELWRQGITPLCRSRWRVVNDQEFTLGRGAKKKYAAKPRRIHSRGGHAAQ